MKLVKHDIKKERGKIRLYAAWKNQMREPRALKVLVERPEDFKPTEMVEFEEDGAMMGFLAGIAEIAWAKGWRPRGLVSTVSHVVANYKEPPAEG